VADAGSSTEKVELAGMPAWVFDVCSSGSKTGGVGAVTEMGTDTVARVTEADTRLAAAVAVVAAKSSSAKLASENAIVAVRLPVAGRGQSAGTANLTGIRDRWRDGRVRARRAL
jgi:hypothetical protein